MHILAGWAFWTPLALVGALFGVAPGTPLALAGALVGAAPGTTLALARVAAGGARWWLTATRSGAERADGPAVLAAGAHRATHYAPCGRCVRTGAMRMSTKCAPRTAPASALLGAPLKSPPPGTACRDALEQRQWRCTFGTQADQDTRNPEALRSKPTPTTSSSPQACGGRVRRASGATRSTGLAASAKRVRKHFRRGCLSGAPARRAASSATGRKTEHRSAVGAFSARPPQ